jgi:hypothetical protein
MTRKRKQPFRELDSRTCEIRALTRSDRWRRVLHADQAYEGGVLNPEQQKKQARELAACDSRRKRRCNFPSSPPQDLYHATAEGAAAYFGKVEVRDYLHSLGA